MRIQLEPQRLKMTCFAMINVHIFRLSAIRQLGTEAHIFRTDLLNQLIVGLFRQIGHCSTIICQHERRTFVKIVLEPIHFKAMHFQLPVKTARNPVTCEITPILRIPTISLDKLWHPAKRQIRVLFHPKTHQDAELIFLYCSLVIECTNKKWPRCVIFRS